MFRLPCLLLAVAGLSACAETDPYSRNYSWQPTGANAINIAAQVANKNDLIRGRGWLDVPIQLVSGPYGKLVIEKGPPGDRVINDALAIWGK